MSNFSYWDKTEYENFIIPAKKAEAFLVTAPEMCMSECRKVAEQMVRVYFKKNNIPLIYMKDNKKCEAKMLGEILYHFGKHLEQIDGTDIKNYLADINNGTKEFHHSKNYACIEDGVAVLKDVFFCLTKLFPIESISSENFSEAEIPNFPKHLLRTTNFKKFISPEMLKCIESGDLKQTKEYIVQHHNDLFSEINGEFPLLVAIQQDEVEIVKLFDKCCTDQYALFEYNLDKHGLDCMHPIFYAAKYNSRKCFDYYIKKIKESGDINFTTHSNERTLLMYACIGNSEEILSKLLIIPEIEIDKKDIYESTALLYLLQTNPNSSYIKILVERGTDLNVESQGRFPLMYATENNLQLFLDNGAKLDETRGFWCLYYATKYAPGSVNQILEILKKEAPNIGWDETAFAYACKRGMDKEFIEKSWNRIESQNKNDVEKNIRFAFKLALQKDNNIEVLNYLYSLAEEKHVNLIDIHGDDYVRSQKNILWLLNKGFYVLLEEDSFLIHPAVVAMLFSRKTRGELLEFIKKGTFSCCKTKEKRTIIEELLYHNQIDTVCDILKSKI